MTTIKLKNGSGAPAASDLVQGEPALDLTNKRLYSEDASGNVIEVGTNPTTLTVDTDTLVVDASNNRVGIGDSSPDRKLAVVSSQSIVGRLESSGSIAGQLAFSDANSSTTTNVRVGAVGDDYTIFTNNAERMRIDSSGNVGIGGDGNAKLEVFGPLASPSLGTYANSAAIISTTAGGYGMSFSVDGTGTGYIQAQNFTSSAAYNLSLNPAGGNVGIGTSSPSVPLTIGSVSGDTYAVFDDGAKARLTFNGDASAAKIFATTTGFANYEDLELRADNYLFKTGTTERMRINSSGNVGIGTAAQANSLEVAGGIVATGAVSAYTNTGLYLSSEGSSVMEIGAWRSGSSVAVLTFATDSGSDAAPVERMRIDGSGNVGINTTSPSSTLDVNGSLSKNSGSFKIDHPLPSKADTHHLVHSFVEGPQADNLYRGTVNLVDGSATVNLDTAGRMSEGTFVLLNTNVQCFTANESGWTAVKGSVSGNVLTITAQDSCADTVSWMVIGERCDQHMIDTEWTDENGRVITEPLKGA